MNFPTRVDVYLTECYNYEILKHTNRLWNFFRSIHLMYFENNNNISYQFGKSKADIHEVVYISTGKINTFHFTQNPDGKFEITIMYTCIILYSIYIVLYLPSIFEHYSMFELITSSNAYNTKRVIIHYLNKIN